nr:unnamed protein product [Callosobruchus analis]
MWVSEDLFTL